MEYKEALFFTRVNSRKKIRNFNLVGFEERLPRCLGV